MIPEDLVAREAAVAAAEHAPLMADGAAKAKVLGRALAWSQREIKTKDFADLGLGPAGMKMVRRVMKGLVREELVEPETGRGRAMTWRSRVRFPVHAAEPWAALPHATVLR